MPEQHAAFNPDNFTPQDLEREINRQVFRQEPAAARLAHALWWNKERLDLIRAGVPAASIPGKLNVLFVGPTGQGKTSMLKLAAGLLKVPFFATTATSYSATGYYGQNVDEIVAGLLAAAGGSVDRAQRGIVLIDEIDKLRRHKNDGGRLDVSGVAVQQGLLGIVEGTLAAVDRGAGKVYVDTSAITFFAAGAFDGLPVPPDEMRQVPGDALVDYGLMPELLGRFAVRAGLNKLDAAGMKRLLVEAESSEIKKLKRVFELKGVELTFTEEWIDEVVRAALGFPTGVRALNEIVQARCAEVMARLPELAKRPGTKVILDGSGVRESAAGQRPPLAAAAKPSPAPEKQPGQAAAKPAPPANANPPRVSRVEAPSGPPAQHPPRPAAPAAPGPTTPPATKRIDPPKPPSAVEPPPPPAGPWRAVVEWVSAHPVNAALGVVLAVLLGVAAVRATRSDSASPASRPAAGETRHRLFPELDSPFGQ